MELTRVVTVFLRHRGDVLLVRRSDEAGAYRGLWDGVSGCVETAPRTRSSTLAANSRWR